MADAVRAAGAQDRGVTWYERAGLAGSANALARTLAARTAWLDGAIALALSAAGLSYVLRHEPGGEAALFSLLVTAPLALRRRWPLGMFAIQFVAGVSAPNDALSARVAFLAIVIGAYSVVVHGRWPLVSTGVLFGTSTLIALEANVDVPIPEWATAYAILLPVALFGLLIRSARSRAEAATQRADAMRTAAVAGERSRIARELHDVVSHHVSVMVIQAGAAGKVIDERPDLARGALDSIAASGREAMTELRHVLGVLAPPGDDPLHPQPGIDQLGALVDKVRAAGQPVSLHCAVTSLPRGVGVAAYRLVQEALTNALRYAPGAATAVTVSTDNGLLRVDVVDDGAPGRRTAPAGAGSGLLGLSERIALYRGVLETGHRPGGGFRVCATIPLDGAP
jgi:signal transduction histidine kinase